MSRGDVRKIVKKYSTVLKENNFEFSKIYLFGSYATGRAHRNSDIDVAIFTSGRGISLWLKKIQVWQLARRVDTRIEPILLNNSEFWKDNISQMAYEVKRTGKQIV